ncbi:MAG: AAA family ATPase, partial [Rothia sp. (in: high G+C Gram-positive bacteria)]|nr:AAA family ATPase [Rothia sp. (in: high G+C Gram-positive bacteria)]
DEFTYGLKIRSGAPGLLSIVTGARGIGKTVMLNEAEEAALKEGWVVISETATPGFLERIVQQAAQEFYRLDQKPAGRKLTGMSVAGVSITTALVPEAEVSWRQHFENLLEVLDRNKTGLLITLDEIHGADRAELSQLAAWVQHFIRSAQPIALIFAGLPAAVSDLLNEGVATFMRRADRIDLSTVSVGEVEASYRDIFAALPLTVAPEVFAYAAEASGGYPFMIQLVGYHLWKIAETRQKELSLEDARPAVSLAQQRHVRMVLEAALVPVSSKDMQFLQAMAQDDTASLTSDLAERLKAKKNTVGNYRARLLDAGLIVASGHGKVDFALPGLRQYLRAQTPQ